MKGIRGVLKDFFTWNKKWYCSYSQCWEDLFIKRILGDKKIFYVDIGANDPIKINNTYKFYREGSNGIIIEPNPELEEDIRKKRKNDIYLKCGIMPYNNGESLTYYKLSSNTLNTFSEYDAVAATKKGYKIVEKLQIPVISVEELINEYIKGKDIGLLSVDVEGFDFEIIQSWPFENSRPYCICIETVEFETSMKRENYKEMKEFMRSKGYSVYADTYVNTIFVDERRYLNELKKR